MRLGLDMLNRSCLSATQEEKMIVLEDKNIKYFKHEGEGFTVSKAADMLKTLKDWRSMGFSNRTLVILIVEVLA